MLLACFYKKLVSSHLILIGLAKNLAAVVRICAHRTVNIADIEVFAVSQVCGAIGV